MKIIPQILLCLALLTTVSSATAQETFAPLVSENCVVFIHVDFRKVELDEVKTDLKRLGEDFLKWLDFDDKSFAATIRELGFELEKLDTLVRPHFDTITKELGIREIAIIADMEFAVQNGPFLAIPWKDRTEKQLETLNAHFAKMGVPPMFVKIDGFLLHNALLDREKFLAWAKNIKPAPANAPIHEAMKSVAGAEFKIAVALSEQLRTLALNAPLPPDTPEEGKKIITFAVQKIQWASASWSLANLLGREQNTVDDSLTVKMANDADAAALRAMLEQWVDVAVAINRVKMEQRAKERSEEFPMPPLLDQFLKGWFRTLLPVVEGDKLVFCSTKGNSIATTGFAVGLLLPAVQAAREAARRAAAAREIKRIGEALEEFKEPKDAFPKN
jgi:hypothetical protein